MRQSRIVLIGLLAVAVVFGPLAGLVAAQSQGIFVPLLVYKTGPYAPSGIPIANGFVSRCARIPAVKPWQARLHTSPVANSSLTGASGSPSPGSRGCPFAFAFRRAIKRAGLD